MSAEEAENLLCSYKIIVTTQAFFTPKLAINCKRWGWLNMLTIQYGISFLRNGTINIGVWCV